MLENQSANLKPGLRSAGSPPLDILFQVSATGIPRALSETRCKFDGYRCVTCGFTSGKYQMTWQCGPSPRVLKDLRTVCPACWQVMNLEMAKTARSGRLVWLPELTQLELNRRMLEVYVARISTGQPSALARRLVAILLGRAAEVPGNTGVADLSQFVDALRSAQGHPEKTADLLSHFDRGLRLLPLDRWISREADLEYNRFPQMLAYWRSKFGPLHLSSNRFAVIAQSWLSSLGETFESPASS